MSTLILHGVVINNPFNVGRTTSLKNFAFFAAPGTYTRYPDKRGRCDGTGTVGIVNDTDFHFIRLYTPIKLNTVFYTHNSPLVCIDSVIYQYLPIGLDWQ